MASGANNNPPELGANGSNSNNQSQTADLGDEHQFKKKKRTCKSNVWIDMIKIDNDTRAQCTHCKECYVIPDTGTTTTLARHLKNCHQKKNADRKQQLLNFQRVSDEDTSSSFLVLAIGSLGDKIICDLDKTPDLSQRSPQNCPKCGYPVDGHYCQGCALLRKKFMEDLFTYCIENGILQDSFEPSYDNTNVVNALQEPFVGNQDPGKTSSQSPSQINYHCCYECGDPLEDIFCHQCTCELCGRGAHYGYNCPPKVPVVPAPEPFNNQTVDELPQTLPSFDPTSYSEDGNSFTYGSTSNLVHDSPNVFSPPLQPPIYSYEFCGNDAYYGQDCPLQVPFTYDPEPFTPSLSIEKPDNSLSMGDEHLDTVPATESNEFIKSSVENLVPILTESEGIPDNMCDVPLHNNYPPLDILKDQFEDFSDFNDGSTSYDDDSFSIDNIEYVEASPLNSELVSSEVMEIVIPEVGGIDDDILLTIKDDILREKLLNINLLIANIEALNDNPTPSSDFMTKSSSTFPNSLLEETNTFDNSLPEFETFCFDLEEISSGSTTTHSDYSLYDSFIFDLSINPFPPADGSDFYEFADELSYILSYPEYDCFCFKIEPNSGDFTMDVVEDTFPTRIHNALPTHPTLPLNLDFILSSESLFAYVVWIFLPFLSYSVAPQYLLFFRHEDTIFDPDICSYHISSFLPDLSHRSGTFIKFNVLNESLMEISFFTCSPMDQ
nr:zinc finger BED domain-containing protein RICESLEEPER 2-like [Tanacetum cinerariifolium]